MRSGSSCETFLSLRSLGEVGSEAEHMKNPFFVYILTSKKNSQKIYIGKTCDLNKRLNEHNREESPYSKTFAPWTLETYIAFSNEESAINFEKYLKAGSGFAFLKKRLLPI
ncbi:MAG: GIY-YIG nuclease family protein [Elusimicrobiales bacterium]|nr:GIY-YIG nuclease family protein [Elusimicrobiales bacterium]